MKPGNQNNYAKEEMKTLKQQTLVSLVSPYLSSYIIYSFTFQVTWFLKMLFSHLVVSNSLWPHGLQHTKLPCPSQSPGVCSDSCLLSQWCHPINSSSSVPFSSCPSVLFSSVTQSCLTLCDPMDCSTPDFLSIPSSWSLLKLMSIESVFPSNHLTLCCPFIHLPSIFPSTRVFSKESVLCIRRPEYWTFSFSINPSNKYSGLISFSFDWLDLLEVQGTLKSLLQNHSSKASILWHSAFLWSKSHIHTWLLEKP